MRPPKTAHASEPLTHFRDEHEADLKDSPPSPPSAWLSQRDNADKLRHTRQGDRLFDKAYLVALRDRDREIENHLVESLSRPLWVKLHTCLRSPQLIEDARQETFLRVFVYFRSGKTLDNPASLPGFVLSVCINVCHEFLRSHTRHEQMPVTEIEPRDRAANPEQRVVTEERKQLVANVLNDLSTKDRQVLRRVFLDEADKDEICHELGVDRGYLRLLVHRAKGRFRTALLGSGNAAAGSPGASAACGMMGGANGPH
jgi:RNA polymerase sigma-70 factor (ECF subfamily)